MSEDIGHKSFAPEAILRYSLPEQESELRVAIDAPKVRSALWEFSRWMRDKAKYGELKAGQKEMLEETRQAFYEAFDGIDLEI